MTSFHFTSPSPMSGQQEDHTMDNDPLDNYWDYLDDNWNYSNNSFDSSDYYLNSSDMKLLPITVLAYVACVLGLLGNGTVFWLLGFRVKRTPFTVYILNLAAADFGVLVSSGYLIEGFSIVQMPSPETLIWFLAFSYLFCFAYCASQFLLTTISTDRCVSLLFPHWYRCHRPEKLSAVLCALMWLLSFLVQGICLTWATFWQLEMVFYAFFVNAVVCLPLVTVSTLILFARFCFKSQQHQRGKLLTAILLTLFFFLFLAFPFNVVFLIISNPSSSTEDHINITDYHVTEFGLFCAILNSFVNTFLYFLVGRKKKGLCRENLRLILQRVFIEEKETGREEPENPI